MSKQDDKDLTIAYMVGYHKRDDLVLALRKRVEELENDPRLTISEEDLLMASIAMGYAISADGNFQSDEWKKADKRIEGTLKLLQHQD